MPSFKCQFTEDIKKKYLCFWRGCKEFKAEDMVCNPGMIVHICSNRGLLDIETHLETASQMKIVRGKSSLFKLLTSSCNHIQKEV